MKKQKISLTFFLMGFIGYMVNVVFGIMLVSGEDKITEGLLYPRESETREVRSLDGVWSFAKSDTKQPSEGLREKWFLKDLADSTNVIHMPVPSSYNDIVEDAAVRDHVGTVWYERKFFVPKSWQTQRVWLRFGSVHYEAYVWINGNLVARHSIGHLPFETEITSHINYAKENRVTVLCDNVLLQTTIPQGKIVEQDSDNGRIPIQQYTFDFFNYAGIHRSVHLYTTPNTFIKEIILDTDVDSEGNGIVGFRIIANNNDTTNYAKVMIYDRERNIVDTQAVDGSLTGTATIRNVKKWWPYLMSSDPAYLYTIEVKLSTRAEENVDVYRMKFGVRTLKWTNTSFLINDKPIYFRGFGRHEDSDIRGKGLDFALLTKDFNLLRWIGANAYRTSHYPYSEESMQFADEHGIMIVDECPSVDTDNYSNELLLNHKFSLEQLIHRDRNHPSVVMWSIANEPRTQKTNADQYFAEVARYTKLLDPSRPITAAIAVHMNSDELAKYLDIISFNRYNAWYTNTGRLDMVTNNVVNEATGWHEKHNKPVLMSEYGADTVEGLHMLPAYVWSEEFQSQQFSKHFEAFDRLRSSGFFIGEFVWNFADFKTAQTYTRVGGNKKGVFTRNRQPKASAHLLRKRYFELASELDNYHTLPTNLYEYTSQNQKQLDRNEL
ncbi:CLUMA_CG008644, isoform B [Clunio marinus]|uniref:Beta-glucuronidase n=1 Tax=Clunio marinus TaxID=568069 RepID=A0A1J1I8L2_9DIPT|nr:CLUMA_CG008644, isoform B [Clunio marinus]